MASPVGHLETVGTALDELVVGFLAVTPGLLEAAGTVERLADLRAHGLKAAGLDGGTLLVCSAGISGTRNLGGVKIFRGDGVGVSLRFASCLL